MKLKFFAACIMTVVLTAGSALSLNVKADNSNWKKYFDSIADKDKIRQYEKELGKMGVTIKTLNLSQAQSALVVNFDVEWKAGTVYIMPTKDTTIKITEKGYISQSKSEHVSYSLNKGTLKIRDGRKKMKMFQVKSGGNTIIMPPVTTGEQWFYNQKNNDSISKSYHSYLKGALCDLIIEVPQRQYDNFEFNSEYASSCIRDTKIKESITNSPSGIVLYDHCTVDNVNGETVNGSINLNNCTTNDVKLEAISGELWTEDSSIMNMDLNVVNGDIIVNKKFPDNECKLSAINGDITVIPKQFPSNFPDKFNASVVNGDITIVLPTNNGFYIPKKNIGMNGYINSKFTFKPNKKNYVYGDGKYLLNVSCTNGDIAIYKGYK